MLLRLISAAVAASIVAGQSLNEARREFDAGNYRAAAQLFEAVTNGPERCQALFYEGASLYRLKQIDGALIAFQSAIACDAKLTSAYVALAEAYGQKQNFDEALKAYKTALEIEPGNAAALRGAASIYIAREENYEALPLLKKLVAETKNNAGAHADLGAVYAATSNHEAARAEFQEALHLAPGNASALTGLANLSFKNGDDAEGIRLLKQAIRFAPDAYEPRYLLGSAYNRTSAYGDALSQLLVAQRVSRNQPEIYYQLARAYGGLGRNEERRRAVAKFEMLSREAKADDEGRRAVAKLLPEAAALIDSGNLNGALAKMEEAHRLRPADDQTLFRLAGLEYDLHKYEAARTHIEAAVHIAPSQWLYHYLLGLVNSSLGNRQAARESLTTALRLNPSSEPVNAALRELAAQGDGGTQPGKP